MKKTLKLLQTAILTTLLTPSLSWAADQVKEEAPLLRLPKETLTHTFSFLPPKDLLVLACVSKKFKEISELPVLWTYPDLQIKTKDECKGCVMKPILNYNFGNEQQINIAFPDLYSIANAGRVSINGSIYKFESHIDNNPRKELFALILGTHPSEIGDITLSNNDTVQLATSGWLSYYRANFQQVEEKAINLVQPAPQSDVCSWESEGAQAHMIKLNFLNENYKECGFSCYWGVNNAFDSLPSFFASFPFDTATDAEKVEAIKFFAQRYIDFRKNDFRPQDEGSYAEKYRRSVESVAETHLGAHFPLWEISYVGWNEDVHVKSLIN